MLPSLSFQSDQPLDGRPRQNDEAVLGLAKVLSEVITNLPSEKSAYSCIILVRFLSHFSEGTEVLAITLPFKTVKPFEP